MLKQLLLFITICCCSVVLIAQQDSLQIKNGIDNLSLLPTHHFGIFSARINPNFKMSSPKNTAFSINTASGNTFHPFVEAYLPKDPQVRKELSKVIWYDRNFNFINQETTPADYMNIVVDAVIKEFRFNATIPLNNKHEIGITLRSHLITKGKYPFSFFTGDESVEWFHSNIAGGEDPYGRRYYGLNQVNFKYTDRNGNVLELNNNDFLLSGFEFNHYYYPTLSINNTKHIYLNFGSHLGINTSKFNPCIDVGVSANALKTIDFKNNYQFNMGVGANVLRKNIINFKETIDLGNNPYLATVTSSLEITKYTLKKRFNAFSINYQIQSRYNKKREADYYRLLGKWQEINGGWQHGFETLYKPLSSWTFAYTYGHPKVLVSLYLQEDFEVNNAPDIQTGLSLKFPILK